MAEESEKKPGFVVHKKAQSPQPAASAPAAPEKKRVVVVRKNTSQNASQDPSKNEGAKKNPVKVVVKKAEPQAAAEKPEKPAAQSAPAACTYCPFPFSRRHHQENCDTANALAAKPHTPFASRIP